MAPTAAPRWTQGPVLHYGVSRVWRQGLLRTQEDGIQHHQVSYLDYYVYPFLLLCNVLFEGNTDSVVATNIEFSQQLFVNFRTSVQCALWGELL